MSQAQAVYSVCGKCFLENPESRRLSAEANCRRHPNAAKLDVFWDRVYCLFYRPVPDKPIRGRFMPCTLKLQCKGEKCTFAHNLAEQQQWNKLKDRVKDGGKCKTRLFYIGVGTCS